MNGLPPTLEQVISAFAKFPGIGKKTAHRLGLHVLKSHSKEIECVQRYRQSSLAAEASECIC